MSVGTIKMEKSKQPSSITLDKLIEEGISYYLDAQYASNRFQVAIASIAQKVMKRNIKELSKALKVVSPSLDKICLNNWPDDLEVDYDGATAWLGAFVWFDNPVSDGFHLGLGFDRNQRQPDLIECHSLRLKGTYTTLKDALGKQRDMILYDDPSEREIGFKRPLSRHNAIEAELQALMEHIVQFWKDNGGWRKVIV